MESQTESTEHSDLGWLTEQLADIHLGSNSKKVLQTERNRKKPLPGLERAYKGLLEMVVYPLLYPQYFVRMNIQPPKGILLYGSPGVGKTHLVVQVAAVCQAKMISIHGPSIYGPYIGESEARLRAAFTEARDICLTDAQRPVIIFIDELDALTPHRNAAGSGGQESRVVAQLLTLMDGMASAARWVIVAATNRPNAIDPALRRPGRLASLCREAVNLAVLRTSHSGEAFKQNNKLQVAKADFVQALTVVTPSLLRSTQVDVASTTWDSIGGLEEAKKKLQQAVEWPMLYPAAFKRLGLKAPRGVLLYGPPGCSKTTLVKAIANTSGATAAYSAYVGESEKIVRDLFYRARQSVPAVIFLDEVDALVGKRDLGGGSSDAVRDRLLAALLNEMDGVETADAVLVVGATNRPDMLDAALLRPGRFDKQIYIPPPDQLARLQILETDRYSGADLQNVCREAALSALRCDQSAQHVTANDFDDALAIVPASLSNDTLEWYKRYNMQTMQQSL
ncbi:P-loop containing nucleoside triphosphate hydrolase protein [Syncephalis fuscata]|nr:P-loop containing nucleoside triphosphate hydrolase protein [Syncephalis fuscata]